jgi:hypothetical protein
LTLYIWGVIGIPAPMFYDDILKLIEIELFSDSKGPPPKPLIDYFSIQASEIPFASTMEIVSFVEYMIMQDHEKSVEDSLNRILVLPIDEKEKPHIGCESIIRYYQLAEISQNKQEKVKKKSVLTYFPKMRPETSKILNKRIFEEIYNYLPLYLQNKDWYLMYSPTIHGTRFS